MSEKKEETASSLKEIAHISGKPGLFKIIKPGRAGVIIESLDEKKEKSLASSTAKVSILEDVSIYTTGKQESVQLSEIFATIKKDHAKAAATVAKGASEKDLVELFDSILPEYDRSRVYLSDIKKVVNWYNLIATYCPSALESSKKSESENDAETTPKAVLETETQKKSVKPNKSLPKATSNAPAARPHTRRKV